MPGNFCVGDGGGGAAFTTIAPELTVSGPGAVPVIVNVPAAVNFTVKVATPPAKVGDVGLTVVEPLGEMLTVRDEPSRLLARLFWESRADTVTVAVSPIAYGPVEIENPRWVAGPALTVTFAVPVSVAGGLAGSGPVT